MGKNKLSKNKYMVSNKNSGIKKEVFVPVLTLVLALVIGLIGCAETGYYRHLKNDCTSETTGIVDQEGFGSLGNVGPEGKYLSTGRNEKYWLKIIVKPDSAFDMNTLYASASYGNVGDELTIYYDPSDPEDYYIEGRLEEVWSTALTIWIITGLLIGVSIFLAVFFNSDSSRKRSRKHSDKNTKTEKNVSPKACATADKYTNERIRKAVDSGIFKLRVSVPILVLGLIFILISFIRTYMDIHADNRIPFNDFDRKFDDTVYSVEITEKPVEVSGNFFDLTAGDDHILAAWIENRNEIKVSDLPVTLRGRLRRISVTNEELRGIIKDYYQKTGYLDSLKDEEYAYYFLDCSKISLMDEIHNHPVGVVFGITFLIVFWVFVYEDGPLNLLKYLKPSCSGRRYSNSEIDAMANDPATEWMKESLVYAAPNALIGINRGLTVVDYEDIAGIKVKEKEHRERTSVVNRKIREWTTYRVFLKTKNNKKLLLTETGGKNGYMALVWLLMEKCPDLEYDIKEESK